MDSKQRRARKTSGQESTIPLVCPLSARNLMLTHSRGWDWGPKQVTCGPYLPVTLDIFSARISGLDVQYTLAPDLAAVSGCISASIETFSQPPLGALDLHVEFRVCNAEGHLVLCKTIPVRDETAELEFQVQKPALWWPAGYGPQALYTVSATLHKSCSGSKTDSRSELHCTRQKVGFRRVELVQDDDELGQSFYFRINDMDVFSGGANWIPAAMDLSSITDQTYRTLLLRARDANMIMIRYVLTCQFSND